jgi:thiol-disulfide isomerase/thioredoxin
MSGDQPKPDTEQRPAPPESAGSQPAYDRFIDSQAALDGELGPSIEAPPVDSAHGTRPSRKSAWLAMGAVAVALGLLWLAPGISEQNVAQNPSSVSGDQGYGNDEADAETDALAKGKPAPLQFTMKDMNGIDVKLASFKGKVILLNFWATWCGPCRLEMPEIIHRSENTTGLLVIAINVQETEEQVAAFANDFKMTMPIVRDVDAEIRDLYKVRGMPTSVFIDRQGKVSAYREGVMSPKLLEELLTPIL